MLEMHAGGLLLHNTTKIYKKPPYKRNTVQGNNFRFHDNEDEILIGGLEASFCLKNSNNYQFSFNVSKQKTVIWNGYIAINILLTVSLS